MILIISKGSKQTTQKVGFNVSITYVNRGITRAAFSLLCFWTQLCLSNRDGITANQLRKVGHSVYRGNIREIRGRSKYNETGLCNTKPVGFLSTSLGAVIFMKLCSNVPKANKFE